MRRLLIPTLAAFLAAAGTAAVATAGNDPGHGRGHGRGDSRQYSIGLWGDLPYSDLQKTVGVPNLVTDMNRQRLAFTAHDGDLKQGSNSPCDDALYENSLATLNSLEAPAVFTPGDNDWTDCDRPNNGGYNSLERLNHERKAGGGEHEATCASRAGGLEQHGGAADVDRRVERRIGDRAADVDLGG